MFCDHSAFVLRGDIFSYFSADRSPGGVCRKRMCAASAIAGLGDHIRVGAVSESETAQRVRSWIAHAEHTDTRHRRHALFRGGGADPGRHRHRTGGSIRGPTALCGIAGIKPTYGLVSRAGAAPAAWSLDHIGPMVWTAEDCALILQALAGHDPRDPASASCPRPDYTALLGRGIKGLKIGVIHHYHETDHKVSEGTQRGIDGHSPRFATSGAELREVQLSPLQDWAACGSLISITERAAAYEEWSRTRLGDFSERMRSRLILGALVSGVDYVQAVRRRRELRAELQQAMAGLDVVLTATQPAEAAKIDEVPKWDLFDRPNFTIPFNVAGYPAISICAGFGAGGLPVAIQLVGKPFQEPTLFRIADAFEKATPFRAQRPALVSTRTAA